MRLITLSLKGMQTLEACTENEFRIVCANRVFCFSQRILYVFSFLKGVSNNKTLANTNFNISPVYYDTKTMITF